MFIYGEKNIMFRAYECYKHKNSLDTVLEVMKIQYVGPEYIKMKVNIADKKLTFHFQKNLSVKIYRKDFWLWDKYSLASTLS